MPERIVRECALKRPALQAEADIEGRWLTCGDLKFPVVKEQTKFEGEHLLGSHGEIIGGNLALVGHCINKQCEHYVLEPEIGKMLPVSESAPDAAQESDLMCFVSALIKRLHWERRGRSVLTTANSEVYGGGVRWFDHWSS